MSPQASYSKDSEPLRADDGTPLKPKEGIVVDQDGNELAGPSEPRGRHHAYRDPLLGQRLFVFQSRNPLAPIILAPLIVILLGVGLTLFTGVAIAAFVAWILYLFFRALRRL